MWGQTCRWAAIRQLSQYLEGQWDYPSQIYSHLRYPSYGPWPHVPLHVLVVILWALLHCCASGHVILGEFPFRCTQLPRSAHAVQQLGPFFFRYQM